MTFPQLNMMLALPELFLLGGIFVIMIYDLFSSAKNKTTPMLLLTLVLLFVVVNLVIVQAMNADDAPRYR